MWVPEMHGACNAPLLDELSVSPPSLPLCSILLSLSVAQSQPPHAGGSATSPHTPTTSGGGWGGREGGAVEAHGPPEGFRGSQTPRVFEPQTHTTAGDRSEATTSELHNEVDPRRSAREHQHRLRPIMRGTPSSSSWMLRTGRTTMLLLLCLAGFAASAAEVLLVMMTFGGRG